MQQENAAEQQSPCDNAASSSTVLNTPLPLQANTSPTCKFDESEIQVR
jgi:hypothetical protein